MEGTNIHGIKRIMTIGEGDIIRGKKVNQYLAQGWVLLHVYSKGIPSDHPPSQQPHYVLGWTDTEHPDLNAILTISGDVCRRSDTGFILGKVADISPIQADTEPRQITEALSGWLVLALGDFERNPIIGQIEGLGMRKDEEEDMWIVWPNKLVDISFVSANDESGDEPRS